MLNLNHSLIIGIAIFKYNLFAVKNKGEVIKCLINYCQSDLKRFSFFELFLLKKNSQLYLRLLRNFNVVVESDYVFLFVLELYPYVDAGIESPLYIIQSELVALTQNTVLYLAYYQLSALSFLIKLRLEQWLTIAAQHLLSFNVLQLILIDPSYSVDRRQELHFLSCIQNIRVFVVERYLVFNWLLYWFA